LNVRHISRFEIFRNIPVTNSLLPNDKVDSCEDHSHGHKHGHTEDKHKSHSHGHGHEHKVHDNGHEHKGHDHGNEHKGHDHGNEHKGHDHGNEHKGHDHGHSHEHGDDCADCGPTLTDLSELKDAPIPEWKKAALKEKLDPMAAPFGGNWNVESSVSASDQKK